MNNTAKIIKSAAANDKEMALINGYSRRTLTPDEVYTFNVILCDNDIDRDGERFTEKALASLATLFIGRTGIFDHNPTAQNQAARIFSTEVVTTSALYNRIRRWVRNGSQCLAQYTSLPNAIDSGSVPHTMTTTAYDTIPIRQVRDLRTRCAPWDPIVPMYGTDREKGHRIWLSLNVIIQDNALMI